MAFQISDGQKRFARIRRILEEIEGNAKRASTGPWSLNHGYVVKGAKSGGKDVSYGIAQSPDKGVGSVFDLNPYGNSTDNMRHIATCNPERMLKLIDDVRLMMLTEPTEHRMQLERANRLIAWMMPYIGTMCPPRDGLFDLNEHCFDNEIKPSDDPDTRGRPINQNLSDIS